MQISLGSKSWPSHNLSFGEQFSSPPSLVSRLILFFLFSFPFQSSFLFLPFSFSLPFILQTLLFHRQIKVDTDIDDA